jgi:uncharacterized paraquat-inducible protein A
MTDMPFIILTCPECQVKNRVKSYDAAKIPVCARCRAQLVAPEENEVHAKYGRSLKNFFNLPDVGLRDGKDD